MFVLFLIENQSVHECHLKNPNKFYYPKKEMTFKEDSCILGLGYMSQTTFYDDVGLDGLVVVF